MSNAKYFSILFLCLFGISLTGHANAQNREPQNLDQLIKWFGNRLYTMGELSGGNSEKWEALEAQTLRKYELIVSKNPENLIDKNGRGQLPLIIAARRGYAFLVSELLKDKRVRETINVTDTNNLSAADYSLLAYRQSIFACTPKALENPFVMVPVLVVMPYYEHSNSYKSILSELEEFGASTGHDRAKAFWLKTCKSAEPATIQIVRETDQLQSELVRLAKRTIQQKEERKRTKSMKKILEIFGAKEGSPLAEDLKKKFEQKRN